ESGLFRRGGVDLAGRRTGWWFASDSNKRQQWWLRRSDSHVAKKNSNPRQHDGVGAETGLQRLSAKKWRKRPRIGCLCQSTSAKNADEGALSGRLRRT